MRLPHPLRLMAMAALISPVLAGCSKEPSEGEMRALVEAHVSKQMTARHAGGFGGFAVFRKQGCVATEGQAGAWDCYYNLVFDPMPGRTYNRLNGKGRFRRNSKAWTYEELSAMPDTRPLTTNR